MDAKDGVNGRSLPFFSEQTPPIRAADEAHVKVFSPMNATLSNGHPQDAVDSINLREYYFIIRRRLWLIVLISVLVLAAGILFTRHQTPRYRSSLTLMIEPNNQKVVDFDKASGWVSQKEYMNTQIKLLKSYALAEKVYRASGLSNAPAFMNSGDPAGKMQRMIDVSLSRDSWMVSVSMTGTNAKAITHLVNILGETFIRDKMDDKLVASREAFSWLLENVEELRSKVQESESSLQEFKKREKDLLLGDKKTVLEARLKEANAAYLEAHRKRVDLETLLAAIEKHSLKGEKNLAQIPQIAQDPRISPLQADYFKLETELTKNTRRYRPEHPEIEKLKEQLASLKERIALEIGKLTETVAIDHQLQQDREVAYEAIVTQLKEQFFRLEEKETQYSILEQEAKSNRELFDVLLLRLKETKLTETIPTTNIRVVDKAKVPGSPFKPVWRINIILSLMLGLMLGVGSALALEYIDDTIKTPEDIETLTTAPFLAIIPKLNFDRGSPSYTNMFHEPYRVLGTSMDIEFAPKGIKRVLVSSCRPSAGKSTTVKFLSCSLARSGKTVLDIDADLRKPTLHRMFGLADKPGLTEILSNPQNGDWATKIQTTTEPNLRVLTSGCELDDGVDLLQADSLKRLLGQISGKNDYVLVDSPPLSVAADSLILASNLDAVLLVVRHGETKRRDLKVALKALSRISRLQVGIVLNCVDLQKQNYYYHGGYYDNYYRAYGSKQDPGYRRLDKKGSEPGN